MKHLCYFLCLIALSFTQAQQTFYGTQEITYHYEGESAEMMAQYMPKGMTSYYGKDKSAVDFNGAAMEAMMNRVVTTPTESFAISHNNKAVYTMDNDFVEQNQPKMENVQVEKVEGETKEILGLTCDKYTVSMSQMGMEMKMVMWVSTKYSMPEYKVTFNQDASMELLKQANINGIVLRLESEIPLPGASVTMIMETTKLDPSPVADSVFEKPEGYALKNFADMPMPGY
ncbi:DUF4412 domain-containing protein [Paucihalobacter ruber]|uniref:DUF4412 domain-containing protein n=1 Tax=Paucihalobacter ruber TaxID=2567861 RepID=A0A506PME9_9FLAO|nr:DUF4412 domain-containing protein [Paucihalobacter ruber]TPV33410.1 DUF4412 domain-containing protein [Paucihalobacter ruber]